MSHVKRSSSLLSNSSVWLSRNTGRVSNPDGQPACLPGGSEEPEPVQPKHGPCIDPVGAPVCAPMSMEAEAIGAVEGH